MNIKNTLYNLIPDYFKTDTIDNVIEKENGVIFYDEDLNLLETWIDGEKVILAELPPAQISQLGASSNVISIDIVISLTSDSYTLPLISTLTSTDFSFNLKNYSGNEITISTAGSDLINGQTTSGINPTGNLKLYIKDNNYEIL